MGINGEVMDENYYKRELEIMTDKTIEARKERDALKEENAKLEAKLWVANDSRLRTYDGLAQKADKYDEVVKELDALKATLSLARVEIELANEEQKEAEEIIEKFKNLFTAANAPDVYWRAVKFLEKSEKAE